VITASLSVVASFSARSQTRIGLTMCQYIQETDFESLRPLKRLSPDALRTLQNADKAKLKQTEKEMFTTYIALSAPDRAPNGRAFTISEKAELVEFCWQNREQFYADCPCLAVEHALKTARTSNALRKPSESDGPDLQHAAVALPYCDVFYSRDGYQVQCAAVAKTALRKALNLGVLCKNPAELAAVVNAF
jgi:hypothetical protein